MGLRTVTQRSPTQEGAAGRAQNARNAEPRAEPRPPGPTSCLRIGPRARQSPPWGPPALLRVPLLPDPALSLRYFSGRRRRDSPLHRRAPEPALPRGDPAKGRAGPEQLIAWAGAGPRPLCRQHHLSRSETSGEAPRGTRLRTAWRGGAGRGLREPSGRRRPAAGPGKPSLSRRRLRRVRPARSPFGGWGGAVKGRGSLRTWGAARSRNPIAEPRVGGPPLLPGARVWGRDFPVSRLAGPGATLFPRGGRPCGLPDASIPLLPRPLQTGFGAPDPLGQWTSFLQG